MSATATATLLLVATVTGVDAGAIRVDAGLIDGLRIGDEGGVYYEISVGAEPKRVDVGRAEVVDADETGASLEMRDERQVRRGYRVEFELPGERLKPAEVVRLAGARLEANPLDVVVERMLDVLVPPDPAIEERVIRLLERRRREREGGGAPEPSSDAPGELQLPVRVIMPVPAGSYTVGVPRESANFFNQQPRFDIELRGFLIDREPVRQESFARFRPDHRFDDPSPKAYAKGIPFDLAQAYCESHDGRLPTEFEWQAAIERGGIRPEADLLEWTASWYKAYPGNTMPEAAYGEKFRVLRGAPSANDPVRHRRRYLDPAQSSGAVAFRCVFAERK